MTSFLIPENNHGKQPYRSKSKYAMPGTDLLSKVQEPYEESRKRD